MKPYPILPELTLLKAKEQMGDPLMENLLVLHDTPYVSTVCAATSAGLIRPDVTTLTTIVRTYLKQELMAMYDVARVKSEEEIYAELAEIQKQGAKAWAGKSASEWVEEMRGNE